MTKTQHFPRVWMEFICVPALDNSFRVFLSLHLPQLPKGLRENNSNAASLLLSLEIKYEPDHSHCFFYHIHYFTSPMPEKRFHLEVPILNDAWDQKSYYYDLFEIKTKPFLRFKPFSFSSFPFLIPGVPFPKNFQQVCKKILSRLFRVFVHVYIHHFDSICSMGAEAHINTCYKHYYYFISEFSLIDHSELEPLVRHQMCECEVRRKCQFSREYLPSWHLCPCCVCECVCLVWLWFIFE